MLNSRLAAATAVFCAMVSVVCAAMHDQIAVCDQSDQTLKVYDRTGRLLWRWSPQEDANIPDWAKPGFENNIAESKPFDGGRRIAIVTCGGRWAVVDAGTRRATAWGVNDGWTHSIELLPSNVVAVASTGGAGGSAVFLYDIAGDRALDPQRQRGKRFQFGKSRGLHWDGKYLWVVDTPGLHQCKVGFGEPFSIEVLRSWHFKDIGAYGGHDLRPIPGTSVLVMTTNPKVHFFDTERLEWIGGRELKWPIAKGFDPSGDGESFLVTTATCSWWTDTLRLYTPGSGSVWTNAPVLLKIPGAKIYKARWVK